MRDGVRLAINLYLPRGLAPGTRIPTIIFQTRYFRALKLRWPFGLLLPHLPPPVGPAYASMRRFVTNGYAWVAVDARGSGASFGSRPVEWSPDEVADGAEVVDWVLKQPWANEVVGTTGISYEGGAAEFLATTRHPAIKAAAPRFSHFDVYTDVVFPGGIRHAWFTSMWGRFNAALDWNHLGEAAGWLPRLLGMRVQPVAGQEALLAEAVREHAAKYDIHAEAQGITYQDDTGPTGVTLNSPSTAMHADKLRAAGIPVYSYSGWFDGGYSRSAINRFLTVQTPGSRLLLGPWSHGGLYNCSPFAARRRTRFDHNGELLRFFDTYLKGIDTGIAAEPPVHYYSMGTNTWRAASSWPPQTTAHTYYFHAGSLLTEERPVDPDGYDTCQVDGSSGTGHHARWDSLLDAGVVRYLDREREDRRLCTYTTPPLDRDLEVTGHPLVTLYVSSPVTDGSFFVYLEDVDPQGHIAYVTEGELRALHRRLSDAPPPYVSPAPYRSYRRADGAPLVPHEVAELRFDLLPISYRFRRRHCIRIAVAGADRDHFAALFDQPVAVRMHRSSDHASHVALPVVADTG